MKNRSVGDENYFQTIEMQLYILFDVIFIGSQNNLNSISMG
jgi:hypothetical protein